MRFAIRTVLMVAVTLTTLGLDPTRVYAQAPAAPSLRLDLADGRLVVLSWTADDADAATRLEAGSAPGLSDLAVIDLPPFRRQYQVFPVPAGTYYVRARALLGSAVSPPSNELAVTVAGCPPLPPTPTLEVFTPGRQTVAFSWAFRFATGCGPDLALVEAGLRPGASDVGVLPVVGFSGVTVHAVPFGTYYTRVRLVRDGVSGHASNEVPVSVACAAPPALTSARADVVGNAVRFSWQYDAGSTADFTVFIEAGSAPGAADIGAIPVPSGANLGFNVSGPAGTYFTRLRAVNACGSQVSAELPVTLTTACPIPGYVPMVDARLGVGTPLTVTWEAPSTGGLVMSYNVDVGSAPGLSDLASRVVDGRTMPPFGYSESFGGSFPAKAYLRVTPVNSCGAGPTSVEAHANAACIAAPPTGGVATVSGRRVGLGWGVGSEFDPIQNFVVEIGTSPFATDVMVTAPLSATFPAGPSFSVDLPPGRYFARARRLYAGCNERSNPSRELTFDVLP